MAYANDLGWRLGSSMVGVACRGWEVLPSYSTGYYAIERMEGRTGGSLEIRPSGEGNRQGDRVEERRHGWQQED